MTPYEKRSFLKLPAGIDINAMLSDYRSIPAIAWAPTRWDVHCSVDYLLLRGGQSGTGNDFTTYNATDSSILQTLPYFSWLVSDSGPLGRATNAFLFRMKPMGVSRPHIDTREVKDLFRIHIPVTTNEGVFLLSESRAKHLPVGEAWTFDNQVLHAALNGDSVRTHLILDVPRNSTLDRILEIAEWDHGIKDPVRWKQTQLREGPRVSVPASCTPLSPPEKLCYGLNLDGFAVRIFRPRLIARLRRTPLKEGDVIYSVNNVEECPMAVNALGYIRLRHKPGETVELGVIRGKQRLRLSLTLHKDPPPCLLWMWSGIVRIWRGERSQPNNQMPMH